MYQLLNDKTTGQQALCILRITDNTVVPMDDRNNDYQAYLLWIAAGNTPLPANV